MVKKKKIQTVQCLRNKDWCVIQRLSKPTQHSLSVKWLYNEV